MAPRLTAPHRWTARLPEHSTEPGPSSSGLIALSGAPAPRRPALNRGASAALPWLTTPIPPHCLQETRT
jgi:hypothetical protein